MKDATRRRAGVRSVALVGMDGSGKSTQAELLRRTLAGAGKRVVLIHPFGRKLLAFLPQRRRSCVDVTAPQTAMGDPGQQSAPAIQLAALAELLDIGAYSWSLYVWSSILARLDAREVWLVSDRSFDDLLIKHGRRASLPAGVLRRARRLAPRPARTIWLDTRPEVAMARDGDFSETYYTQLYGAYARAAQLYGWEIVSTESRSPAQVQAEIECLLGLWTKPAPAELQVSAPVAAEATAAASGPAIAAPVLGAEPSNVGRS